MNSIAIFRIGREIPGRLKTPTLCLYQLQVVEFALNSP